MFHSGVDSRDLMMSAASVCLAQYSSYMVKIGDSLMKAFATLSMIRSSSSSSLFSVSLLPIAIEILLENLSASSMSCAMFRLMISFS